MCSAIIGEQRRYYYLSEEHVSSLTYKLCSFMIFYYRKFLGVDRNNIHQVLQSSDIFQRSKSNSSRQKLKIQEIWPIIVLTLYIVLTVKLCAYAYLKFQQDSYRFRRDRLMLSIESTNGTAPSDANTGSSALKARLNEYSNNLDLIQMHLKQLGDPYIEARFLGQIGSITLIALNLVAYFSPQFYTNYVTRYEYFLARMLFNESEEYAHCKQLIDLELRRLASSSRHFLWWICELGEVASNDCNAQLYKQLREQIRYDLTHGRAKGHFRRLTNICTSMGLRQSDGVARYLQDHCKLTRQLLQLRNSKRLHPINRVSEEWIFQNESQFVKMNIVNTIYSINLDTVLIYVGHLFTNYKLEFVTLTDRLFVVELYFYCMINVFATNYHMSMFVLALNNKTRYLNHVRQQLIDCIRDNDRKFALLHDCLTAKCYRQRNDVDQKRLAEQELFEMCSNELNSKVIEVYLRYRIFMDELDELQSYWSFSIPVAMALMFITPVFARVYIPYITEMNANMLVLGFVFSLAIFTNLLMMPLCKFSKYGESTYKIMCSLLAHCMELQVKSRQELAYGPIYMEHLIGVLRKELDDPREFLDKFSASWLGITATFSTLIQWHVYYGLVIVSLFCEISSWRTLLGDRLDDPLALLKS